MNKTPCAKCGSTDTDSRGRCKGCRRIESKKYREKYPDRNRQWQQEHPGYSKEKSLEWRIANQDKICSDESRQAAATRTRAWLRHNKARASAVKREWYVRNKASVIARAFEWKKQNPEKKAASAFKMYWENHDAAREKHAKWRAKNPEALRVMRQNRRARKLYNGGKLSKDLASRLYTLQNGKCACCGKPLNGEYHLDHIMPLALGGLHADSNIQLLLPRCNKQKHAKHPDIFMQQRASST